MSVELGIITDTGPRGVDLKITRFWGGEKIGICLQLTADTEEGHVGYVQLSANDMKALLAVFENTIHEELTEK